MPKPPIEKHIHTLEHMDVVYVPIDDIIPNNYNPNRQSDQDFELLCRSIEEDGFTQPILVNKSIVIKGEDGKERWCIVDGEHRWRALQILGRTEAPIVFSDMTLEQAMISTLRHNRARGSEDINKAADVIRELDQMGALEHAADSLMMDQVELDMFTTSIPTAELHLRTDDMTMQETEATIAKEKELLELKAQEELLMGKSDRQRYTIQLTFMADEAYFIKSVIGRNQARGIVDICTKALAENLVPWVAERTEPA